MKKLLTLVIGIALLGIPAFGQQTGSISGKVTLEDGSVLPGVLIEAASEVLPRSRTTTSSGTGEYRLPLLPPGDYELTFTMDEMATEKRAVEVLLDQDIRINVIMRPETLVEEIQVTSISLSIDPASAELKATIPDDVIEGIPVGQEYRDLLKLIPGVQYTEDSIRGPSAGGNGQDNVYLFDGVNVSLPLYGTLSTQPSSHDIDQIAVVKGGAKALDFNRSGGFLVNSVSKSGTSAFHGQVSYQIQTEGMTGTRETGSNEEFEQDQDWSVVNIGGPLAPERLFFYLSYYRPTVDRQNRSNVYGEVPDYKTERDELFGKLDYTPTSNLLFKASYRDSEETISGRSVTDTSAGSTSVGDDSTLNVAILEGSWVVSDNSFASFKYTDFENPAAARPDTLFDFDIAIGQSLDINNLDQQGQFTVPRPVEGNDAFNAFIGPIINRYGYLENGVPVGGGDVGGDDTIDNNDFYRESWQLGYDYMLGRDVSHELHFGYQWYRDEEDLVRLSNGWGAISVPGGRDSLPDGTPVYYEARIWQQTLGDLIPPIHSEFESQNIELNDTIRWQDWSFNIGFVLSNDTLYGQGLRPNPDNPVTGLEQAPGHKYKMYELDFGDMIQPRLGAIWAYNGQHTVYANYAKYLPAASSLPRAASWDRNLQRQIDVQFDANGNFLAIDPVSSSSGKWFQDDLDPRSVDEYLVGTSRQFSPRWTGRAHFRYRKGGNFWEDTNNNARLRFNPPEGIPQELYIPNLDEIRAEIGGSSYVIAELDGAFTKYYEANLETEWRGSNAYVRGSYVWSHYYGNFDQDNSSSENDLNIFVGSSFIADGAGRQLWDYRYGNLRGDRRHQLKLFGYYSFEWNASAGVFAIYQSGQPWEIWDVEVYRDLTGSTSDTSRYGEPAGSRTTDAHYQIDLNYTQDFRLGSRYTIQLRADVFNVLDKQTGYNIQNRRSIADFTEPRDFFDPRRLQLAVKFLF